MASAARAPEVKDMTQNEYRELRRVFQLLAGFAATQELRRRLTPRLERRTTIKTFQQNPSTMILVNESGAEVPAAQLEYELGRLNEEISELTARLEACDAVEEGERKIRPRDLQHALSALGKHCEKVRGPLLNDLHRGRSNYNDASAPLRVTSSQREIEDMIWEVDENLDGAVDWGEFLLMFRRNVTDKTGLEPFQLFAVVQFCMYDKEFVGKISVDETMQMLYARCGRDRLEAEMKALFGDSLNSEGTSSLSFNSYLESVRRKAAIQGQALSTTTSRA